MITYVLHVVVADVCLDRGPTTPPGSIFMPRSGYRIYLYFNMTAFFFKPSNWDSSQGARLCLQLKAQRDSIRAQQPNSRWVRAAVPVQQKGKCLEAKGGAEDGEGAAGSLGTLPGRAPYEKAAWERRGRECKTPETRSGFKSQPCLLFELSASVFSSTK